MEVQSPEGIPAGQVQKEHRDKAKDPPFKHFFSNQLRGFPGKLQSRRSCSVDADNSPGRSLCPLRREASSVPCRRTGPISSAISCTPWR